ncbi:MAG TPA: LacI family DNA-binding transcriptional regulator [Candidatus Dormibacteraeota bacterium]|nr:LacI family DNA-binding transcriptional regulator [Candidatus Dormibacteraeota bacterium]
MARGRDSQPIVRRQPTIFDVASQAGVSKSTVSNVVRGLPGVSAATRLRVQGAILELGYRPNVLARQLVQQRTSTLGVVVGDIANPFFAELAKSVERHAAARGYTAILCNTGGDGESELAGIETLLEYRVAGIVFLRFSGRSHTMQQTLEHHVPVVFVSCTADWGDTVSVDDIKGGVLATEHLIGIGHRRIAYLSILEDQDQSDLSRFEGYRQALLRAGLGPVRWIGWSPPADHASIDGKEVDLLDIFSGPDRVTAVFAAYDGAAIALQDFADRANLRVPKDLSIVGFDDVPTAGMARIALTTVAQPRDELAGLAIATITDRVEQRFNGPPRTQLVGVSLVIRRSTAPPSTA